MIPLETRIPNTVSQQATDQPVSEHVIVLTLACHDGRHDPDDVREALAEAVDRGDVERVEEGYRPAEWDEWNCPRAR